MMENYRSLPEKNYCKVLPFTAELKVPSADFAYLFFFFFKLRDEAVDKSLRLQTV